MSKGTDYQLAQQFAMYSNQELYHAYKFYRIAPKVNHQARALANWCIRELRKRKYKVHTRCYV